MSEVTPSYRLKQSPNLHDIPLLSVADPKVIAEILMYELAHGETEVLNNLAKLLEYNRNEAGKNITAIVATATLPVNRQPNYLFDEKNFAEKILSHLSPDQINQLKTYNTENLQNPVPDKETILIREVFGAPEILKDGEGNSFLANFLTLGKSFAAANTPLQTPQAKPNLEAVEGSSLALCMLSMCLKRKFMPLVRHDSSHLQSGYGTTVKGEIYNQTHDFAANTLAQYGVVPTIPEQRLNRRVIYSFYGLPQKLEGLQRDWQEFSLDALETWREFLVENPEYADKWELSPFLDQNMRMIKPDGTPIISDQTGEQQIPIIDYTDLSVLRHLQDKLENLLTDEEIYASQPYSDIYADLLRSIELLSLEYIFRDGAEPVLVNGIYDSCATQRNIRFGETKLIPHLAALSSKDKTQAYDQEDLLIEKMRKQRQDQNKWQGYFVECGQDYNEKIWVTDRAPCLHVLHPEALTIYRVVLPLDVVMSADTCGSFFGGSGYLVDPKEVQIDSVLTQRNEDRIPKIGRDKNTEQHNICNYISYPPEITAELG